VVSAALRCLDRLLDLTGEPCITRAAPRLAIGDDIGKRGAAEPAAMGRHVSRGFGINARQHPGEIEIGSGVEPCPLASALAAHKRSVDILAPPAKNYHLRRTARTQLAQTVVSHHGLEG